MTLSPEDRLRIEHLLPFWVNGTLRGDEVADVADAVEKDRQLQRQADVLRRMRAEMQNSAMDLSPGEFGLMRLSKAIEADAHRKTRWQPYAAGAALAAAVAATGLVFFGAEKNAADPTFTQASGTAGLPTLTVQFVPDATASEIAALMLRQGLVFVDGPSAIGLYRLASFEGLDLTAAAEGLRAEKAIVQSVETAE